MSQIGEDLSTLAWAQWAALGVPGADPAERSAIDLEALILLTAYLGTRDKALAEVGLGWCATHSRLCSKPRLKQLLSHSPSRVQRSFGPFARCLEELIGGTWPSANSAASFGLEPTKAPALPSFSNPALLALKMRCIFGVNARADLLTTLLGYTETEFIASELTFVGYTKRNIAEALDALASGEVLERRPSGNRIVYSWRHRAQLLNLVKPVPKRWVHWSAVFRWLLLCETLLSATKDRSEKYQLAKARKMLTSAKDDMKLLSLPPAPLLSTSCRWAEHQSWLSKIQQSLLKDA